MVNPLKRLVDALFVPEKPKGKAAAKAPAKASGRARDPRAELARLIRALRGKLDPALLKIGERLARQGPPTTDQDRARLAIELFLQQRNDGGKFRDKLKDRIAKERQRLH